MHVLSALKEFLQRYGQVFKAAWSVRATLDPPKRSGDELAFLPAHLELTDTPVSPASRWIMRTIMAFFCLALLWAVFGKLDIVAVASGKTVVSSRTKIIQPAETAVVKRILVKDGQTVREGQLLIELDATSTGADHAKAGDALVDARLAETRLAALVASLDSGLAPTVLTHPGLPAERLAAEQQLATSQYTAYRANRDNLQASISQRLAEIETVRSMIGPLEETATIATNRARDYAGLVEGKYVARHEYLLREQERIAAERDLTVQRSRLQEALSALRGSREALAVLDAETRQQALDGLRQAREAIRQLAPELAKAGQREQLMQLHAPVSGTVQQLAIHTIGGVVTPAQALLAIVPNNEGLEIEAMVQNKDIGFVRPGQRATVKVESFPYTRYGYLQGTIESVSQDAAQDENLGLIFPARVRLQSATLVIDGAEVRLTPGMSLSVEIKTGKRSVISYLLSPLNQRASESLRER